MMASLDPRQAAPAEGYHANRANGRRHDALLYAGYAKISHRSRRPFPHPIHHTNERYPLRT